MATKTIEVLKVTAVSTDGVRSVRKAPKGWTLETKVWAVEGKSHNTKTGHQSRIGQYFDNKVAAHGHADALNEGNAGRLQFHKGKEDRVVYAAKVVDAQVIAVEVEVEVPDTDNKISVPVEVIAEPEPVAKVEQPTKARRVRKPRAA